jgi:membrane protein DedA with SNARE-associated domain
LVLIGYFGAKAIQRVTLGLEHAILASSVLFIVFVLWFGRRLMKREISKSELASEESTDE